MTEREELFLHALCVCVRALTLDQAMRYLRFTDTSNFSKWVSPLIERDLVRTCRAFAKPVPEMREPLVTHGQFAPTNSCESGAGSVGAQGTRNDAHLLAPKAAAEKSVSTHPNFVHVLRLARARWAGLPASSVTVYVATKRAGNLFGVLRTGQLRKQLQATHDLCVSEVFLVVDAAKREGEHWYGEDLADYRLAGKVPDAVIRNPEGVTQKVIEVVGADYEEAEILRIHNECNVRKLLYELW